MKKRNQWIRDAIKRVFGRVERPTNTVGLSSTGTQISNPIAESAKKADNASSPIASGESVERHTRQHAVLPRQDNRHPADTNTTSTVVPQLISSKQDPYEATRIKGQKRYEHKLMRRQITHELDMLYKCGSECETSDIIAFITRYNQHSAMISEIMRGFKFKENFPITMIQRYISGGYEEEFAQLVEDQRKKEHILEFVANIKQKLREPIVVSVNIDQTGPLYHCVTREQVQDRIKQTIDPLNCHFSISGNFDFDHIDIYPIEMHFLYDYTLNINISLRLVGNELPHEYIKDLHDSKVLEMSDNQGILDKIQIYLDGLPKDDVLTYYPQLSAAIVTGYKYGYGKTSYIQDLLREWSASKKEHILAVELRHIRGKIKEINQNAELILDEDEISGIPTCERLVGIVQNYIDRDAFFSLYKVELKCIEEPINTLAVSVFRRGVEVGVIEVRRPKIQSEHPLGEDIYTMQEVLDYVLLPEDLSGKNVLVAEAMRRFKNAIEQVQRDLQEYSVDMKLIADIPTNLRSLTEEARRLSRNRLNGARGERFLALSRYFAEQGNENFTCFCLAEYCFSRSMELQYDKGKTPRLYLQVFLYLHAKMPIEIQKGFVWPLYQAISVYFYSFDFNIDVQAHVTEIEDKYFQSFLRLLEHVSNRRKYEMFGQCILEIAVANQTFVFDTIDLLKSYPEMLKVVSISLRERRVFLSEPLHCLQILSRIDGGAVAAAFHKLNLPTSEERRLVVIALLKFADDAPADLLDNIIGSLDSDETRTTLAFALLVEPFVLSKPERESNLKARLISDILNLSPSSRTANIFLNDITEIALQIDRFIRMQEPGIKLRYGVTITHSIKELHKYTSIGPLAHQFLRRVESHIRNEQSKVIVDTKIEMSLVSDRVLYSSGRTRVAIELCNIGDGFAENLQLEVSPVINQYDVEERYQNYEIDPLLDRTPIYQDIFIQPLVAVNSAVELSLTLSYDTQRRRGKIAELPQNQRSVWLYPEANFLRVLTPYNTGQPATTWFYGRQKLLESMSDSLRAGDDHDISMIVYGLKRTGKTSMLKRFISHTIKDSLFSEKYVPIYADMLRFPDAGNSEPNFLYRLMAIIAGEVNQKLQRSITIPTIGEFHQSPFTSFTSGLEATLQAIDDRRILVLLDEFSVLYRNIRETGHGGMLSAELFGFLSNTIQSTNRLTFVFAGTYMMHEMMRETTFDLAKICRPLLVSYLDDQAARQLIVEPVMKKEGSPQKGWLEYDQRAVNRIVTVTNSHPYLIQYICAQIVDRMNNDIKQIRVNTNDVEAIITDLLQQPRHEAALGALWHELDPLPRKLLSAIASESTADQWIKITDIEKIFLNQRDRTPIESIVKMCSILYDAELLENSKTEEVGAYKIKIPLYQMWLRRNKPIAEVFGRKATATVTTSS